MAEYKKRIADRILTHRLEAMGAVLIEGPKYCGKTSLAVQQARSILYMADPEIREQNRILAQTNISRLLQGDAPRLIDEWQLAPQFWDAIRHEVDRRGEEGQFILTGSSVPADADKIAHTGTGRFSWLRLRTMSLWESGESSGDVSLKRLFDCEDEVSGTSNLEIGDLAFAACRGGWPSATLKKNRSAALLQAQEYCESIARSDISRSDGVDRDPELAKRLLRSYARHQGQQVSTASIWADIRTNESGTIGENTVHSYIKALKRIFVVEDALAWNPNLRSKTAIRTSDTRYFADPSIATAALGLGPEDLLSDPETFGLVLETLCMRDLRAYSDALRGTVYHYRDKNGLECDAVVHLPNGKYGLIEMKLGGETLIEEGAKTLHALTEKLDTDKMHAPAFRMVLTGVGKYAYKRPTDGIMVVPIGCLKD